MWILAVEGNSGMTSTHLMKAIIVVSLIFYFFLGSCSKIEINPSSVQKTDSTTSSAIISTPELPATRIPIKSPTSLIIPTSTSTHIPTPSDTATMIPTYTWGPTFSPVEEEKYWIELINTNRGCELPCWWGITPGKSPESDLLVLSKPGGLEKWYPWPTSGALERSEYALHVNPYNLLNLSLTIYTQNGIVQYLAILADNVREFPNFSKAMQRYSLSNVFLQYGKPSRILLFVMSPKEVGAPPIYDFWVFYDDKGILILYEYAKWTNIDKSIHICPGYPDIRYIGFYLISAESKTPLDSLVDGGLSSQALEMTLEKTTNLSLDDFYSVVIDPNRQACFDTPKDLWP
jgi:hypothetical protein